MKNSKGGISFGTAYSAQVFVSDDSVKVSRDTRDGIVQSAELATVLVLGDHSEPLQKLSLLPPASPMTMVQLLPNATRNIRTVKTQRVDIH
mmetsp:Transcript_323/g.683  ORF Transcript_323/g.683 Transcript_323/m.683 type:complete len:91 (+) Transcript_323:1259-1531(+)